ncbi:MAG: ABC transporter ATP-binding protein [Legionellales bacterium]|nr:ABC transporter ATP-binding protein [Legionellales bacterium]OUX65197.1 MAG: ABC transporter ATP-binding protein [Gammaproteobacteria bacterium TMED281]
MNENIIQFNNVKKSFKDQIVLKAIDLTIKRGEKIVLCGPSGSGKSTLIRCINGLEKINGGSLIVDNCELYQIEDGIELLNLRKKIGMVFQQFNLFPHLSIIDNCTLAPLKVKLMKQNDAKELAMNFLKRVGIEDKAYDYPINLSGGQQQRAAIARALCMSPEILLFDEPTSALDPEMVKEVLDVIEELAAMGITMICVTHEMAFAEKIADKICFLSEGEILEISSPSDFFNRPSHPRLKLFLSQVLKH